MQSVKIPVDTWYKAIFLRHSQRKYSGVRPAEDITNRLDDICSNYRPFEGTRAVLARDSGNDVFRGIIGSYFKITDAPYYIAFIGDMTEPVVQEVTGYIGEGIILDATALGLNTCWVGGFFRPDAVAKQIDLQDNEQVLAVTPIGYSKDEADRVGVTTKTHRRKDLNTLIMSGDFEQNSWSKTAIEAARLAPSAVNRQPWRFEIEENAIGVIADGRRVEFGISKRLDCGIAMQHIELAAVSCGVEGRWEFLEHPRVAVYRSR